MVVQGPIVGRSTDPLQSRQTHRVLASVRKVLPGVRIILSTWKGSDVAGLDADEVVFSEDPGGVSYGFESNPNLLNNVNRQICSTLAGLRAVRTLYAVKTRTDVLFEHAGFLDFFDRYREFDPDWAFVKKRVVTSNVFARNPRVHFPFLYHPGDFFYFGLTEDLLAIWDIPLQPKSFSRWFLGTEKDLLTFDDKSDIRYYPEQYIWMQFLEKFGCTLNKEHASDFSVSELEKSEKSIANNLVLVSDRRLGLRWLKQAIPLLDRSQLYTPNEWLEMYYRLVLGQEKRAPDLLVTARPFLRFWEDNRGSILTTSLKHGRNLALVVLERVFIRAPRKLGRFLRGGQVRSGS